MDTIEKQNKILKILKSFSDKRLEEITGDNFSFKKMSRQEMIKWMDCVWITLGKESATDEEMILGINEVLVLATLESLMRLGLVHLNKEGNFDRTKLGKEVLNKLKN